MKKNNNTDNISNQSEKGKKDQLTLGIDDIMEDVIEEMESESEESEQERSNTDKNKNRSLSGKKNDSKKNNQNRGNIDDSIENIPPIPKDSKTLEEQAAISKKEKRGGKLDYSDDPESNDKEENQEGNGAFGNSDAPEKRPNKILKAFLTALIIAFIAMVGIFVYQLLNNDKSPVTWAKSTVEYGDETFEPVSKTYGVTILNESKLDPYTLGEQTVTVQTTDDNGNEQTFTHRFTVEDTQKPTIKTAKDVLNTVVGEIPDYESLKIKATDPVDGAVSYEIHDGSQNEIGTHNMYIKAIDSNGNVSKKKIRVNVKGYVTQDGLQKYRNTVAALNSNYKNEQELKKKAEEETESNTDSGSNAVTAKTGRIFWIGDSRFVGMENAVNPDNTDIFIAKGSMGYSWFVNTAVPEVTAQLKDGDTIIVNMGVNGFGAEQYANELNSLANGDWKNANIIFMSVNPIDDSKAVSNGYSVKDYQVEDFNNYMKSHLASNIKYLDTYSRMINGISSMTFDGVHYSSSASQNIFNWGKSAAQ